jgi:[acyl-carrier-protein] S-malonyltransferase
VNKFAFVFPGQGSQQVGMLSDFAASYPIIQEIFNQASEQLGYDLWLLTQTGPKEQLDQTEFTQPALLAAGYAMWCLWKQEKAVEPKILAGHSLGEYTALVCAQALDFKTAIELVAWRGRFMQEAVPPGIGGMAAIIGLSEKMIEAICNQASGRHEQVTPANFNSIGQIVIAGHSQAVDRAVMLAKEKGALLSKKLPVSVPSHCDLMKPAALKLEEKLQSVTFRQPIIPVVHNTDIGCYSDIHQLRKALVKQLYTPVRWVETIQFFEAYGIQLVFESGPGKVLTGLNKRITESLTTMSLDTPKSFSNALNYIGETV